MGAFSSKAAKTAAGAAQRQFPKTASPPNPASTSMVPPPPGPTVYPKQPHANSVRDDSELPQIVMFDRLLIYQSYQP